ncbi:hypothetical protein [Pseudarthrobacter sp. WHRI 8279]
MELDVYSFGDTQRNPTEPPPPEATEGTPLSDAGEWPSWPASQPGEGF